MPKSTEPLDLVDYEELEQLTGIKRSHLRMMKTRGTLPAPAHPRVAIWRRNDIVGWMIEHGKA